MPFLGSVGSAEDHRSVENYEVPWDFCSLRKRPLLIVNRTKICQLSDKCEIIPHATIVRKSPPSNHAQYKPVITDATHLHAFWEAHAAMHQLMFETST